MNLKIILKEFFKKFPEIKHFTEKIFYTFSKLILLTGWNFIDSPFLKIKNWHRPGHILLSYHLCFSYRYSGWVLATTFSILPVLESMERPWVSSQFSWLICFKKKNNTKAKDHPLSFWSLFNPYFLPAVLTLILNSLKCPGWWFFASAAQIMGGGDGGGATASSASNFQQTGQQRLKSFAALFL